METQKSTKKMARAFGRVIRNQRVLLKMSQQEVADRLGVHHSRVSFFERGESLPMIPTVLQLCAILDLKPIDVFRVSLENADMSEFKLTPKKLNEATELLSTMPQEPKVDAVAGNDGLSPSWSLDLPLNKQQNKSNR